MWNHKHRIYSGIYCSGVTVKARVNWSSDQLHTISLFKTHYNHMTAITIIFHMLTRYYIVRSELRHIPINKWLSMLTEQQLLNPSLFPFRVKILISRIFLFKGNTSWFPPRPVAKFTLGLLSEIMSDLHLIAFYLYIIISGNNQFIYFL